MDNHGDSLPGTDNGMVNLDDDCIVVPPTLVLARAYINKDGNPGYASSVDIEIARLEDTDASGDVSVDDKISLQQYPTAFNPYPAGTCSLVGDFGVTTHIVTSVSIFTTGEDILLFTNTNQIMQWTNAPKSQTFETANTIGPGFTVRLSDSIDEPLANDVINATLLNSTNPTVEVDPGITNFSISDDAFLDVFVTP